MERLVRVYPELAGSRLDDCSTCHAGGDVTIRGRTRYRNPCDYCHFLPFPEEGASGAPTTYEETLNAYGSAYAAAGRSLAAIRAIAGDDSDGDGFANEEEIADRRHPGDAGSRPGQPRAATIVLDLRELEGMPSREQLVLVNSHRGRFDAYVRYRGVRVRDLLESAGVKLDGIEGITVISVDGFRRDFPREAIVRPYPRGVLHAGLDVETLGADCGFVDYPEILPSDLVDGGEIPGVPWLLLAYGRDDAPLESCRLDPASGKIDGEGPLRIVVPQSVPGAPDRGSDHSPSGCDDGHDYDESKDHNAGAMVRGVVAIRLNPFPEGYEEFDARANGWTHLDAGKLVLYGHGIE
jgi:hypothetical protein